MWRFSNKESTMVPGRCNLCHKYERITCNLGEHVNLEAKLKSLDIQLIATERDFGSSNESKIMRTLSSAMSEYYIDSLADEAHRDLREIALRDEHTGGTAPFGYDIVDKHYVINELEAGFVRQIHDQRGRRPKGFPESP